MSRPVYTKAIIGSLSALATWGGTAMLPDENGVVGVSAAEWFGLLGMIVAGGLVYLVANGEDVDPTTSTPEPASSLDREAGVVDRNALVGVALLILVAVVLYVLVF